MERTQTGNSNGIQRVLNVIDTYFEFGFGNGSNCFQSHQMIRQKIFQVRSLQQGIHFTEDAVQQ